MMRAVVTFFAVITLASADITANQFVDSILLAVSQEIRNDGFDALDVEGFDLRVRRNGLLNREFKASFGQGAVIGLSTAAREGDCTTEVYFDNYSIKCEIVMPHARLTFDAIVKGDAISAKAHWIATNTYLTNVRAEISIDGKVNNHAQFRNLTVISSGPLETSIVKGYVSLNSGRRQEFFSQMNEQLSGAVVDVLNLRYAQSLRVVVPRFIL